MKGRPSERPSEAEYDCSPYRNSDLKTWEK